MKIKSIIAVVILTALTACSNNNWTVNGVVEGADGMTLALEAPSDSYWYKLDTLSLSDGGEFEFSSTNVGYPNVYRLCVGNQYIYFPIDSVETVSVIAKFGDKGLDYSLDGTDEARLFAEADTKINAVARKYGEAAVATDSVLKKELGQMILDNRGSLLSYYLVNKKVGATKVFNPAVKSDLRFIGAAATGFSAVRPNDVRAKSLSDYYLENKASASQLTDTLLVAEIPIIDFELPDDAGKKRTLAGLTSQGNVVVLNFTTYDAEASPAFNMALNQIYSDYKDRGLEIVQVAVDQNQFVWEKTAKNLPWVTLYAPDGVRAGILMRYNVGRLPSTFIINRRGDLVERVDDITRLSDAISRYL